MTFSLVFLMGCATSPTGRTQLTMMPQKQMEHMGAKSFKNIKAQKKVVQDGPVVEKVECIAEVLTTHIEKSEYRKGWEVVVFKAEQANAFAVPGKKIGVFTGIVDLAESPEQLATVLGHEVGHVLAEHANERVSQAFLVQGGMAAVQRALEKKGEDHKLLLGALGLGVQFGAILPFSRKHESEADVIGLELMAQAGFNPEASVHFWRNMKKQSGKAPPEFMSTHPAHATRIKNLKDKMPKARRLFKKAKTKNPCRTSALAALTDSGDSNESG